MAKDKILVINPGSTSTKVAVYDEKGAAWVENIPHADEELGKFTSIYGQLEFRTALVAACIREHGTEISELCAAVGRGGLLPPVPSGAILVDELMVDCLKNSPVFQHPSNLGAGIALYFAEQAGVKAYVYDPVTVDELSDVARITGIKDIKRLGQGHNLNMRAAALRYCREQKVGYKDVNLIVAHLGGGVTISIHEKGRISDLVSDDEGPFSPERAGEIGNYRLIRYMEKIKTYSEDMIEILMRRGGLRSHFGTADTVKIEAMAKGGDKEATLVYEAMALGVAKAIGKLSVNVCGKVDQIIITGGIAHSEYFTKMVKNRVSFIAPVTVMPGENEMQALAEGVQRVLSGGETAHILDADFYKNAK